MKKLLVLTAVGILLCGAAGCRMCDWLFRGSAVTAQPAPVMYDPCATAVPATACDPCGPATGMMVTPGPETYVPAPR
jgi:hypothetical protein